MRACVRTRASLPACVHSCPNSVYSLSAGPGPASNSATPTPTCCAQLLDWADVCQRCLDVTVCAQTAMLRCGGDAVHHLLAQPPGAAVHADPQLTLYRRFGVCVSEGEEIETVGGVCGGGWVGGPLDVAVVCNVRWLDG